MTTNPQVVRETDKPAQPFLALLLPPARSARCVLGSTAKGSAGSIHDMSMTMLRMLMLQTHGNGKGFPAGNMDVDSVAESMDHSFLPSDDSNLRLLL